MIARRPSLLVLALVASALALAACGSTSSKTSSSRSAKTSAAKFDGSVASPTVPAPHLSLHDSLGRPVNIRDYRGKAVFITFLYTHCPDVCPLIASHLHSALALMGSRASRVKLIAVSVDPKGDTPATVARFLRAHGLTGNMEYLIGSPSQLRPVWKAWNISSETAAPSTVNHSALVYGISATGRLTTLYPANFAPADIVHDVAPLLAS